MPGVRPEDRPVHSVDPILDLGDPQQWNGYSYANNTPVTHSDPSGLCLTDSPGCFSEIGNDPIPTTPPTGGGGNGGNGGNGGSGNGGGGGKKGFWGQIGSGLKKGFTNAVVDPFLGAVNTITNSYADAYQDINGVITGEMSALDAAIDIGSITSPTTRTPS